MRATPRKCEAYNRGSNRRGLALLIVMVCLVLVGVVGAAAVKTALWQQRQIRQDSFQHQADWLAEAGCDRAFAQLQQNPQYSGETWQVSAAELGTPHAAQVVIAIEPAAEGAIRRSVSVVVEYPAASSLATRVSRKLWVEPTESR